MSVATPKVCLITGNHLCHNPRALKEADALHETGLEVIVLGAWLDEELAERDKHLMSKREWTFAPVIDLTAGAAAWQRFWPRARTAIGRYVGTKLDLPNHLQLGYCAPELLRAARHSGAELFIAHSEQALWVAHSLLSAGHHVGVDMEDWFSEDLMPQARSQRPLALLRELEGRLLREGRHTTCPSQEMSRSLATQYGCRPPTVIYNAFKWSERSALDGQVKDRRNLQIPSVHWYSKTLGPGRGLEDLFQALAYVEAPIEIHLRGNLGPQGHTWLRGLIPAARKDSVFVHPPVPNSELLSRIAEHDIGFAGERDYCRSRDLTVTNKLLQYLLAGVPVVASDTSGQREIAGLASGAIFLYRSGDARALGAALEKLLHDPDLRASASEAALDAAHRLFCWERVAPTLTRSVEFALSEASV